MEKQRWEESQKKSEEEKRSEKRKSQEKEDGGARTVEAFMCKALVRKAPV